jgi:hypothetical protein
MRIITAVLDGLMIDTMMQIINHFDIDEILVETPAQNNYIAFF